MTAGSCSDQARRRSIIPPDILVGNRFVGIYINSDLIRRLAQVAFDNLPKTLDSGGQPDANGPIHLTSLSVGFTKPNLVETYIGGFDDRPWPDVSFTTTITDYLGDPDADKPQKTGTTSGDTKLDREDLFWAGVLGGLALVLTYAIPILTPLTSFAFLGDIESLLLHPDNPASEGVGRRILELLPDYIPLPQTGSRGIPGRRTEGRPTSHAKKEKLVITYDLRPKVDERGIFVAGTPSREVRRPRVHIVGPTSLTIVIGAHETFGYYTAEPDDFYGPLTYVWSGGSTPQNPGQRTKIAFPRGTAQSGSNIQRTITIHVTDREGSIATASLTVSIYISESSDLPTICRTKPWLPECQG